MQNNHTFISIKEPCHQGWSTMSPSEKGRFCSSCNKHVHDFSFSSIDEIKKVHSKSIGGLCGHIPVKLLQEQNFEREVQKLHYSYLKKFCLAAVLCFGANLFTIDSVKASTFTKFKTAALNLVKEATKDSVIIKGVVQDKDTYKRIAFVSVAVLYKGSVICSAMTNINGEYEVKIPLEYPIVDMKAVYIGYESRVVKNVALSIHKNIVVDIDIQVSKEMMLEGDIDINYFEH